MTTSYVLLLSLTASATEPMSGEFYQDFRKGPPPALVQLFGPGVAECAKSEPQGLRITLPANRKDPSAVGVSPRFTVGGDFEITARYEVLSAKRPAPGPGVGVKAWIQMDSPRSQVATLAHWFHTKQGDAYFARYAWTDDAGEKKFEQKFIPTGSRKGQLRLRRTGSILYFLAADDASSDFRELFHAEVGTMPVRTLRLSADTEGPKGELDIRLVDLRVREDKPPAVAMLKRGWLWAVLLGIGLTGGGLGVAGYLLYLQKRRKKPLTKPAPARPVSR